MSDIEPKILITPAFDTINKKFLQKIESLKEILPLVSILINANEANASKGFLDYVKDRGKSEKDENGELVYSFSPEDAHNVTALQKGVEVATTAVGILPKSLFVSLISQFDNFLSEIIREIFKLNPQILNASEKNLTFSKLMELKDLEEAKELIIEREIESILRESHTSHFVWLEEKLKITLRKDLPIWQTFIEITERRNLFVHCDGVVSSQYLSCCRKNSVEISDGLKLGIELDVNQSYFEDAFKCLYELSTKLTQVIWRKLKPDDLENADGSLNEICYELIKNGQFDLSDILLDFATRTLPKKFNEETKTIFLINQALSLKLGGNKSKSDKIVIDKDWSATNNKFKIAKETLLDNFEKVAELMKTIGPDGEISKFQYKIWPLFSEFRKTLYFTEAYKEVFNEDYTLTETPKKLYDQIMNQVALKTKEGLNLNTASFLEVSEQHFLTFQFISYKAESFVKTILELNHLTKAQFKKAIENNIEKVKRYNEFVIFKNPTSYLNPYTLIRHCLYLSNKTRFEKILYEVQIDNFETWLKDMPVISQT